MATLLRILVAIAFAVAAIAIVFGLLPGYELRQAGRLVEVDRVIEHPQWLLGFLVLLLAPGIAIWRRPSVGYALCWSLWGIAVTMTTLVATYGVEPAVRFNVVLWPARAFAIAVLALVGFVIAVVPIATGIGWLVTRNRPARPALPRAHVVRTLA